MGIFAWLFPERDGRQTSHPGRSGKHAQPPKATQTAAKPSAPAGNGVYSVERSVTTLIRSGLKRRKTTSTTREWRHGNCQVRHKSKAAAKRCRNA